MSAKTILLSVCGILLIGGITYITTRKTPPQNKVSLQAPVQAEKTTPAANQMEIMTISAVPTKDAPSDAIVDYLVDGLAHDDTVAADASIDATRPAASDVTTVNTNF